MNTTLFYELHDRLYDRASAVCASIAEDFRLKRAVETWLPSRKPTRRSRGSGTCARSSSRSLSLRCSSPTALRLPARSPSSRAASRTSGIAPQHA